MKIVGYNASPRKKGNTAWTVNKILEGAKEKGAEVTSWNCSDLDIRACQSCYGCKNGDMKCVLKDDMQKLYEELIFADAIVLGSPVYMGQVSGQAKVFMDRMSAEFMPRFSPFFKEQNAGKKLILAFTQGNPDAAMFQQYFDYTKKIFEMLEFDVVGVQVVEGTRNKSAQEREDLHNPMMDLGSLLVAE